MLLIYHSMVIIIIDITKLITYSDNCVLLVEQPKAVSAEDFSEIEFVLLYNANILLKTDEPLLFFTPMQNAASLISADILYDTII